MNEPQSEAPKAQRGRGQLFEEAAAWVEKMRGPDAEQYRTEHNAWLKLGALHPSAYNLAEETYLIDHPTEGEPDLKDQEGVAEKKHSKPWALLFAAAAIAAVAASWTALRPAAPRRRHR